MTATTTAATEHLPAYHPFAHDPLEVTLLRAARRIISRPECWTKGAGARTADGTPCDPQAATACRWCLLGAIQLAARQLGFHIQGSVTAKPYTYRKRRYRKDWSAGSTMPRKLRTPRQWNGWTRLSLPDCGNPAAGTGPNSPAAANRISCEHNRQPTAQLGCAVDSPALLPTGRHAATATERESPTTAG